jgi:hypothetical protein
MHRLLHLVIAVKCSFSQSNPKRAKYVIVGWSEVWAARVIDGGKCYGSNVWSCIVLEKKDAFGQKSATTTANFRLQSLFQHGAAPNNVDCFSFLLTVFENWSIHTPQQCQHKFSCINDSCSAFLKSFYTLVHFPPPHTASTILLNHSSVNFPLFHSFWPQNLVTERCSSLVQFSSGAATILALSFESRLSCHRCTMSEPALHMSLNAVVVS